MPRKIAIEKLYETMKSDKWKVRRHAYIGDMKNGDPRKAFEKYLTPETPIAQRAVAFSFYRTNGKESDLEKIAAFEADKVALPVCEGDDECKWTCDVPKDEKKPEETESKEMKTFGDFVKYCVVPTIKWRAASEKAEKAAAEKKGDKK
jgi:hypothetical protein